MTLQRKSYTEKQIQEHNRIQYICENDKSTKLFATINLCVFIYMYRKANSTANMFS